MLRVYIYLNYVPFDARKISYGHKGLVKLVCRRPNFKITFWRGLQINHAELFFLKRIPCKWKLNHKYYFKAVQKLPKRESSDLISERTKQTSKRSQVIKASGETSANHMSKPTSEPSKSLKRSQAIWVSRGNEEVNKPANQPANNPSAGQTYLTTPNKATK